MINGVSYQTIANLKNLIPLNAQMAKVEQEIARRDTILRGGTDSTECWWNSPKSVPRLTMKPNGIRRGSP